MKLTARMIYDPVIDQIILFTTNIDVYSYNITGNDGQRLGLIRGYETIVDKPTGLQIKELETLKRLAKMYPQEDF